MSYDLAVYSTEPLTHDQMSAVVEASDDLVIGGWSQNSPGNPFVFTINRGKRKAYCFTVEGPYSLEPEDVPEDVTAIVLGASHLYSVLVEGSANASAPHAIRFAKRLAKEGMGALLNPQTEEIWPPTSRRRVARPDRGSKIDVVGARWCHLLDEIPHDFPDRFLRIARRHLPEALPLRFGSYEPRQSGPGWGPVVRRHVHERGFSARVGSLSRLWLLLSMSTGRQSRHVAPQGRRSGPAGQHLTPTPSRTPSGGSLFSGSSSTSP